MNNDLISRSELIKELEGWIIPDDEDPGISGREYNKGLRRAIQEAERAPAAAKESTNEGYWRPGRSTITGGVRIVHTYICSQCGGANVAYTRYCPNCGLRMSLAEEAT